MAGRDFYLSNRVELLIAAGGKGRYHINITPQAGAGRLKVNKSTRSDKGHKGGPPRVARVPAEKGRPAEAARRISTDAPVKRFIAPRLSRAARELLHRYFAMPAA